MRTITTDTIIQNIKEMCIEANYSLTSDVKDKLYQAAEEENSPLGRQIPVSYTHLDVYKRQVLSFRVRR